MRTSSSGVSQPLVQAMKQAPGTAYPAAAEVIACECAMLAEPEDHFGWQMRGRCPARSTSLWALPRETPTTTSSTRGTSTCIGSKNGADGCKTRRSAFCRRSCRPRTCHRSRTPRVGRARSTLPSCRGGGVETNRFERRFAVRRSASPVSASAACCLVLAAIAVSGFRFDGPMSFYRKWFLHYTTCYTFVSLSEAAHGSTLCVHRG